jgi:phospholipase D1/2
MPVSAENEEMPPRRRRDAVLRPGRNCWRIAQARRMAVIVDAAAYFAALKEAVLQARHEVLLIGWDFDTRIKLEPDGPGPGIPDELGKFLSWAIRQKPGLRINVLKWDLSILKMPFRGRTPLVVLDWMTNRRLRFRLDGRHPPGASHHQKVAVIDGALAFCGGIDMTADRWDTPAHIDADPRRIRPSGRPYGPWHDATAVVDGEAARALADLARDRWFRATGKPLPPIPEGAEAPWPGSIRPAFEDVEVAVSRTDPLADPGPAREIEALHLDAIASARRLLYIESQYLASSRMAEALASRLREPGGPEVIIVTPRNSLGWLEAEAMGAARALIFERLRAAGPASRFRLLCPVTERGDDIYVHAKVMVMDDRLLRIGSSNLNNRSMGLDTECDLVLEDSGGGHGDPGRRIGRVRMGLLAEHLGTTAEEVGRTEERTGSMIAAVDRLRRSSGRTLVPYEPPVLGEMERWLAEEALLDPDRPEPMSQLLRRGTTAFPRLRAAVARMIAPATALDRRGGAARGKR